MTRAAPDRIPFLRPELPPIEAVIADLRAIYDSGTYSNGGVFEERLAAGIERYLGVAHCVPVANGTLGLMLAARVLARREGGRRRVLLPSFTFPASALAMEWAGLEPVFCDVDPQTWQPSVDPEALPRLGDGLALVLLCSTFGAPCDLRFWQRAAETCGLPLLIDSASGLGGRYPDGRQLGSAGVVEVFSMHATKAFGVGEGGLVTTPDADVCERLRLLRNFGLGGSPVSREAGLNAKLSEIHAAIACRVLEGYGAVLEARRCVARAYRDRLEPYGFRFQKYGELSPYQCVSVRLPDAVPREPLQQHLASCGIETRQYFDPPLHRQPRWSACPRWGDLAATESLCQGILSLPISNRFTQASVDRVCGEILAFAGRA